MTVRKSLFFLCCFFCILLFGCTREEQTTVILDTDLSSDVDDVGAVALLHSLAQEGNTKIIAMMVSSGDIWSGPCLKAINSFYGKHSIPIGQVRGESVRDQSNYTEKIAKEFGGNVESDNEVPDAVILYRKVLSEQLDQSVTLITVGYLTNLKNLLNSKADLYSPLSGRELVKKKVKILFTMGGEYPEGREWNFYQDISSSSFVIEQWPTPIVFCGYELGKDILTGKNLGKIKSPNPLTRSYELYNGLKNRSSWDQATVLFALKKEYGWFNRPFYHNVKGKNKIYLNGNNVWMDDKKGTQSYMVADINSPKLINIIEDRMVSSVEKIR